VDRRRPTVDVARRVIPATGTQASADLVVVRDHDDGSLTAIVADVCGHGDQAASIAARVRPAVERHLGQVLDPSILLERINADLSVDPGDCGFLATAVAARVEPDRHLVTWASAGHAPPHQLSTGLAINGAVPGPPIGVRSFVGCTTGMCRLAGSGDGVLLYTDGLADVRDARRERFGAPRIAATLAQLARANAREIAAELERRASDFGEGKLPDDVCLLVVRLP
jgi:phosphoserine phosphatase RsbU/P